MTLAVESFRPELEAIVGASDLISDRARCAAFAIDGVAPEFVLTPSTTEKVAEVLVFANQHGLALIPIGSGTKISTGNRPRGYDAALCPSKLNRVIHYEPGDLTVTVEAGMKFGDLVELVGRDGLWLPLDPRGGAKSTVGGIIAANSAGPLRQVYGGPRDMVLGLKIVTPDGKIAKTGGRVVKNVAGYDLGKLLTGSFGTLGVIVEASLKLFTKPRVRATFVFQAGTLENVRKLRREIRRSPLDPLRLVLVNPVGSTLLPGASSEKDQGRLKLWTEFSGSDRVMKRCQDELKTLATSTGMLLKRVQNPEPSWDRIADPAAWLKTKHPEVTTLKAALPPEASEEFLALAQRAADAEHVSLASFAQAGVGIIHICLLQEKLTAATAGLVAQLREAAASLGGTLIIEQSPANLKRQIDVWGAVGDDLVAMQQMKSAWDPRGILSPGRFVGGI